MKTRIIKSKDELFVGKLVIWNSYVMRLNEPNPIVGIVIDNENLVTIQWANYSPAITYHDIENLLYYKNLLEMIENDQE